MPGATVGAALSGDVVRIEITALAANVRTARLVSGATARRAGLDEGTVDEIKLAVGEACTRAVELHIEHAPAKLVEITVNWDRDVLTVAVGDRAPAGIELPDDDTLRELASPEIDDPAPGELALAVVQGLVDDVTIEPRDGGGTTVTMRWPLAG
jgi:anti-sigma regulatory factor (Ser/Thr protein kinase)